MKNSFFLFAGLLFINSSKAQVDPPSVKIGSQTWMLKNLDVDHYRNGDIIPMVTQPTLWAILISGAWSWSHSYTSKDSTLVATYGRKYNWFAVNDPRGLAPFGWHIPSDAEWDTLVNFLGGPKVAGGKMKEAGTMHWVKSKNAGDNSSGWTGLPGYYGNDPRAVGGYSYWWSSTERSSTYSNFISEVWSRSLFYNFRSIERNLKSKQSGLFVRCVKD